MYYANHNYNNKDESINKREKYWPGELNAKPEATGEIVLGGVVLVSWGWDNLFKNMLLGILGII